MQETEESLRRLLKTFMSSAEGDSSPNERTCSDTDTDELGIPDDLEDVEEVQPKQKSRRNRRNQIYKSLPQNQCPSACRICRSPAVGYHYEVPSCSGCKTFFRRTIITGRKFKCFRESNCLDSKEIIETSKRICRACRFEKCVQSGMNPMAIQAEMRSSQGFELRNEVVNRRESTVVVIPMMRTEGDLVTRMMRKLSLIESKIEPLHRSGLPPGCSDVRKLEEILDSKLLLVANEIPLVRSCKSSSSCCSSNAEVPRRCSNYSCSSLLASVESSKMFDFFSQMDLDKKVLLMKHATIICSNMMNAFFSIHQMKSDVLLHPDGSVYDYTSQKDRESDLLEKRRQLHQKTLIAFLSNKIDRTEYLLFKAIMLCNPAVPGLSVIDQTIIEKERNEFVRALLNYCLLQHGRLHGPARFSTIISLAPMIERQAKGQKDIYVFLKVRDSQHLKALGRVQQCTCTMFEQVMES